MWDIERERERYKGESETGTENGSREGKQEPAGVG